MVTSEVVGEEEEEEEEAVVGLEVVGTFKIEEEEVVVVGVVDEAGVGSVARVSSGECCRTIVVNDNDDTDNKTERDNPSLLPMQMSKRSKRLRPKSSSSPAKSPPDSPSILTDLDMALTARQ